MRGSKSHCVLASNECSSVFQIFTSHLLPGPNPSSLLEQTGDVFLPLQIFTAPTSVTHDLVGHDGIAFRIPGSARGLPSTEKQVGMKHIWLWDRASAMGLVFQTHLSTVSWMIHCHPTFLKPKLSSPSPILFSSCVSTPKYHDLPYHPRQKSGGHLWLHSPPFSPFIKSFYDL